MVMPMKSTCSLACTTLNPKLYLTHDEYKLFANYFKSFSGHSLLRFVLLKWIHTAQTDANKQVQWILCYPCQRLLASANACFRWLNMFSRCLAGCAVSKKWHTVIWWLSALLDVCGCSEPLSNSKCLLLPTVSLLSQTVFFFKLLLFIVDVPKVICKNAVNYVSLFIFIINDLLVI